MMSKGKPMTRASFARSLWLAGLMLCLLAPAIGIAAMFFAHDSLAWASWAVTLGCPCLGLLLIFASRLLERLRDETAQSVHAS